MAEDVDAGNPRKKIKLDEKATADAENKYATENVTSSTSGIQRIDDNEQQDAAGPSETNKADKKVKPPPEKEKEEGEEDEDLDSESSISGFSDLSDLSGEESWKGRRTGPMSWVYRNMEAGVSPRELLEQMLPDEGMIPNVDDYTLWKLVISIVTEPPARDKLPDINTIEDVISLMRKCTKIMVLTGAGVSVSCGIPDFRSRNGVYARLAVDFPDLPDPQAMFDIKYFRNDQRPFFKFAKEIFPGQFEPSKCHKFIKLIESHGKLLRNYTQNIDTLEQVAGIQNIIQCHGSFATASCMKCSYKCPGDDIKSQIMDQIIPMCPKCDPQTPMSVMKPDIVFFGESLPDLFHNQMSLDKDQCDLLIVIGSSLKVRPVALIPNSLPPHVPQILINKEALRSLNFDVELLGDCDTIIGELCRRLGDGWETLANKDEPLTQISFDELLTPPATPTDPSERKSGQFETGQASGQGMSGNSEINASSEMEALISEEPGASGNSEMEVSSETGERKASHENGASKQSDSVDKLSTSCDTVRTDGVKASVPGNGDSKTVKAGTAVNKKVDDVAISKEVVSAGLEQVDKPGSGTCTGKDDQTKENCKTSSKTISGSSDTTAEDSIDGIDKNLSALNSNTSSGGKEETEAGDDTADSMEPDESADPDLKSMWKPKVAKISVAQRLGPNQYCLIPPHRYVFNEAEVFTTVGNDSDSDNMHLSDTSDDDSDLDMDTSGLLPQSPGEPEVTDKIPESEEHVPTSEEHVPKEHVLSKEVADGVGTIPKDNVKEGGESNSENVKKEKKKRPVHSKDHIPHGQSNCSGLVDGESVKVVTSASGDWQVNKSKKVVASSSGNWQVNKSKVAKAERVDVTKVTAVDAPSGEG